MSSLARSAVAAATATRSDRSKRSILPLELRAIGYRVSTNRLLDDVSLRLEAQTRTIVLGPNGAGKSLLLRICHGLVKPTTGTVLYHGDDADVRAGQAMVLQRPVLLRRSVVANISYALRVRGVARGARVERTERALALAGLVEMRHRSARVLSAGEQQRLAIARAWSLQPELLFLDEPTASLDPASTRAVEQMLESIHGAGTAIVMTTQELGQARRLAERIVFLHQGRVIEDRESDDFFAGPHSEAARAFVSGELT